MLRHLLIKNFATISDAEIDLREGLNIITGETGAGKSIVVQAVSLALGARADSSFVRSGEDKAIIQLVAEDEDGESNVREYIITREIARNGKKACGGACDAHLHVSQEHDVALLRGFSREGRGREPLRGAAERSEERRVGKECRSRWSPYH